MLREMVLGKEHPDTLRSMNNLAVCLDEQKKWDEAEPLYRETLMLREMVLGKEHPDTLLTMYNLATMLADQERYEEAEQVFRETWMLSRTVLGKNHRDTLLTRDRLASVLRSQGKKWKNLEGDGDDVVDGKGGDRRRERGRRRARMSAWAKRTINAIHR